MLRRTFVAGTGGAALAKPLQRKPGQSEIGIDLFSIRSSGIQPFEYLDYAAKQGANVVHFSEIRFIGNLEPDNLRKVRAHAEKLGIELELGMRSICPTSKAFDAAQGQRSSRSSACWRLPNSSAHRSSAAFWVRSTIGSDRSRSKGTSRTPSRF